MIIIIRAIKKRFEANDKFYYRWIQVLQAILVKWKIIFRNNLDGSATVYLDHHVDENIIVSLENLELKF